MVLGVTSDTSRDFHRSEQLGECPRKIVGIQGILQQLFGEINKLNSEAKNMQEKTAKMEVLFRRARQKLYFAKSGFLNTQV